MALLDSQDMSVTRWVGPPVSRNGDKTTFRCFQRQGQLFRAGERPAYALCCWGAQCRLPYVEMMTFTFFDCVPLRRR